MMLPLDRLRPRAVQVDAAAVTPGAWATMAGTLPTGGFWAQPNSTAVTLPDGHVLLTGGEDGHRNPLPQSVLLDPASGTWTLTAGQPQVARRLHAVSRFDDGRVLVTGGVTGRVSVPARGTDTAEMFNPANGGSWQAVASMNEPRFSHSATLLANGTVLVAGGCSARSGDTNRALRSAEIYDPATNKWTVVKPMTDIRFGHTALRLKNNNKVLVIGGAVVVGRGQYAALAYCEIFDPSTSPDKATWTPTASMRAPRKGHQAVSLNDGTVLAMGGDIPGMPYDGLITTYSLSSCERFTLDANGVGSWAPDTEMPWGLSQHRAVLLPTSGRVLVVGGTESSVFDMGYRDCLLYEPAGRTWTPAALMTVGRWAAATAALPDDKVFVAGGVTRSGAAASIVGINDVTATAEVYTP